MLVLLLVASIQTHPVARIDSVVEAGIDGGVYPGAVVVVGTADTVLFARGFGHLTWNSASSRPSPDSTLYDLASLTKVVATTSALMVLVDRGTVDLDRPVASYLPEFTGPDRARVTVRDLLRHRSGLRAFLPLHTLTQDAAAARARVFAEAPRYAPQTRTVYSDLNAMLAGWVVEAVVGRSLDVFADSAVFTPLRMDHTRYRLPAPLRSRAAPINVWRGHPIQGVVHDQNAERLGGVAGHAGLYSTGRDLARYAQFYLRGGKTEAGPPLVGPATVRDFIQRGPSNRALGWEVRDTTVADNTGRRFTPQAFGHGGYTGTSMWIDPDHDLFLVVLTNRVYAPRTRRSIRELKIIRGRLADAAVALRERTCRLLSRTQPDRARGC